MEVIGRDELAERWPKSTFVSWKPDPDSLYGGFVESDADVVRIAVTNNGSGGTTFRKQQARLFALAILDAADDG